MHKYSKMLSKLDDRCENPSFFLVNHGLPIRVFLILILFMDIVN